MKPKSSKSPKRARVRSARTSSGANAALAGEMILALHRVGEAQRLIALANEHLLRAVRQFGEVGAKLRPPNNEVTDRLGGGSVQ